MSIINLPYYYIESVKFRGFKKYATIMNAMFRTFLLSQKVVPWLMAVAGRWQQLASGSSVCMWSRDSSRRKNPRSPPSLSLAARIDKELGTHLRLWGTPSLLTYHRLWGSSHLGWTPTDSGFRKKSTSLWTGQVERWSRLTAPSNYRILVCWGCEDTLAAWEGTACIWASEKSLCVVPHAQTYVVTWDRPLQ